MNPNDQVYNQPYDQIFDHQYINKIIPVITVVGSQDMLVYDNLQDNDTRYIAPVFYAPPSNRPRVSNIFPEHYRAPTYFPYRKSHATIIEDTNMREYIRNPEGNVLMEGRIAHLAKKKQDERAREKELNQKKMEARIARRNSRQRPTGEI